MKAIKAKVYYTKDERGTHYSGGYPSTWEAPRIPCVIYGDADIEQDRTYQWVIAVVPDDLYEKMILDEQCEAITKTDAVSFGNQFRPQVEKITNPMKVLTILAKVAREENLTMKEKDAINPNHPEQGIGKSKSFEDICNAYGVKWQ